MHHYWQFYFMPFVVISIAVAIRWLCRPDAPRRRRILLVTMCMEIACSSAYKLYRRHTEPDAWTIQATRDVEEKYLTPRP